MVRTVAVASTAASAQAAQPCTLRCGADSFVQVLNLQCLCVTQMSLPFITPQFVLQVCFVVQSTDCPV